MNYKLNVPYYAQNSDEDWDGVAGNVQCAPTSNTMLLAFIKPDFVAESIKRKYVEPESYYTWAFDNLGYSADDRGNHDIHTKVLSYFGLDTVWRTNLLRADISKSLSEGFPVVVGLEYKTAGHICIIVGETDEGYLIHDPYGIRNGTANEYTYINPGTDGDTTGSYDLYAWASLEVLLFVGGSAWGRLRK